MTENLEKVYVYENSASLSAEKLLEKGCRLKAHCEENGYLNSGGISISLPMSRCGSEFPFMVDYCWSRGISKILVDGLHDIGSTPAEVQNTASILCNQGFQVEVADCGLTFSPKDKAPECSEDEVMTMGGM